MAEGKGFPGDPDYSAGDERPTSETGERRRTDVYHHSSRDAQNTDPNPPKATPTTSTSKSSSTQGSRTIVGLMFFATSFALIGNELEDKAGSPITSGSKIILGGIVATSLLTLVSHAGDTGRQFAVGVALVTPATSLLVFGGTPGNPGQVWKKLGAVVGTTKATTPTASTAATTPTKGTATAVALTQAA